MTDNSTNQNNESSPAGEANGQSPERQGSGPPADDDRAGKKKTLLQRPLALAIIVVVLVVATIGGVLWWLHARQFESTDDAFIDTHIVRLAPQTAGRVTQVMAEDNALVQAGATLVVIDSAALETQVTQARAQAAQAQAAVDTARSEILVDQRAYQQAVAEVASARATADKAALDLERYRSLQKINPSAVAREQIDDATAAVTQTAAQLQSAQRAAQSRTAQIEMARTQVAASMEQLNAAHATLADAGINLGYTRIVAPVAGHVVDKTVAVGNYVEPGTQMLAIVPLTLWVTANFKETQLALMRPGQSVSIRVDACPSQDLPGHVDSIQRGAGQAFQLLPPQNATGNFVKVVQRVPVKIDFDRILPDCPLGPGMSVEPTVRVR